MKKVKHGKRCKQKEIVVTPNDGYRVLSISVNGEKILIFLRKKIIV